MRNCLCPPCCSVSVQLTEPPNKPRSLPSKVHRLLRDGVWGADGERRPPTVVRLGNTERALPAALVAHVDAIVVRWEGCGGVPSVCVCAGGGHQAGSAVSAGGPYGRHCGALGCRRWWGAPICRSSAARFFSHLLSRTLNLPCIRISLPRAQGPGLAG